MTAPAVNPRIPTWGKWLGFTFAHIIWNTKVYGSENVPATGPVVLAANHTGVVDGPVVFGSSPRVSHMLIKESMFTGTGLKGVMGKGLLRLRQIPIDQANSRPALAAAKKVLDAGDVIGIFPEGRRGRGDLAEARAGAAWLALNCGAAVVPVAILGTRRTGESTSKIPGFRRRLVVQFGEPVTVSRAPGMSGREALAQADQVIQGAMRAVLNAAVGRGEIDLPQDEQGAIGD